MYLCQNRHRRNWRRWRSSGSSGRTIGSAASGNGSGRRNRKSKANNFMGRSASEADRPFLQILRRDNGMSTLPEMVRQIRLLLFCIRCGKIPSLCSKCSHHISKIRQHQASGGGRLKRSLRHAAYPAGRDAPPHLPAAGVRRGMAMQGAGDITGPQLIAEIGDMHRFTHKGALVTFTGMDAPPFQSGTFDSKSRRISKRGPEPSW